MSINPFHSGVPNSCSVNVYDLHKFVGGGQDKNKLLRSKFFPLAFLWDTLGKKITFFKINAIDKECSQGDPK